MADELQAYLYQTLLGLKSTISGALSAKKNCHFNVGESLKIVRDSYLDSLDESRRGLVSKTVPPVKFEVPKASSLGVWTVDAAEAWRLYSQLAPLLAPKAPNAISPSDSIMKVVAENRKVFVVHGHDEAAKQSVARFLEKLQFEPVILHEQASQGSTIIEKFEKHADVSFAIILLTPDDEGRKIGDASLKHRSRQNVVLELGYFIGRLGRDRVCALYRGDVEIPSDYLGVLFISLDEVGAWRLQVAKEMRGAGLAVDMNLTL